MRQATFRATITDTTPAIVTALLARAGDDPSHDTKVWPPDNPAPSHPHQGKHHPRTFAGMGNNPLPSPTDSPTGHRVDRRAAIAASAPRCMTGRTG